MKSGVQILFKFKKKQETDKAKTKNQIIELLSNRIIIMGVLLTALFCVLIYRLFVLQIIQGDEHLANFNYKIKKTIEISGARGNIYDCKGKILAYNQLAYTVTLENSEKTSKIAQERTAKNGKNGPKVTENEVRNEVIYKLVKILEQNGDTINYSLPMTVNSKGKLKFTVSGSALTRFKKDIYGITNIDNLSGDEKKKAEKYLNSTPEEVYEYLICAICPVDLSKPGLGFLEEEHRIGPRVRDWVVGAVDTAFLFPAFNDRSTDIHSTLFYTKNTKEPHSEFMANGLGCGIERTATEQKMAFHSIVRNVLGAEDEHTDDVLLDLQQNLSDMIDEYAETHDDDEDVFLLDKEVVTKLLADSEISEEKAAKIEKSVDEAFGEKPPAAENVIDSKALVQNELRVEKMALEDQVGTLTVQLTEKDEALAERTSQLIEKQEEIDNYIAETKTYDVVLRVKPEKASQIKSQVINGQKCLVIPMGEDEHATINGVNTTV